MKVRIYTVTRETYIMNTKFCCKVCDQPKLSSERSIPSFSSKSEFFSLHALQRWSTASGMNSQYSSGKVHSEIV